MLLLNVIFCCFCVLRIFRLNEFAILFWCRVWTAIMNDELFEYGTDALVSCHFFLYFVSSIFVCTITDHMHTNTKTWEKGKSCLCDSSSATSFCDWYENGICIRFVLFYLLTKKITSFDFYLCAKWLTRVCHVDYGFLILSFLYWMQRSLESSVWKMKLTASDCCVNDQWLNEAVQDEK